MKPILWQIRLLRRRRALSGQRAGFSLAELLVVVAIFSIVAAAVVMSIVSAQRSMATGSGQAVLTMELRRALDRMSRELVEGQAARVTQPPTNGSWDRTISFQIPQDRNGDGSVLDAQGNIAEWSDPIEYSRGLRNALIRRVRIGALPGGGPLFGPEERLANHIVDFQCRRPADSSNPNIILTDVIEIQMTASTLTETGQIFSRTMGTRVKLRN